MHHSASSVAVPITGTEVATKVATSPTSPDILVTTKHSKLGKSVPKEDNIRDIIDVDSFKFEDTLEHTKTPAPACKGYTLSFPDSKSPHTVYPFALHDTLVLPWDYMVKNSAMSLFARSCTGHSEGELLACQSCRQLPKNKILEGVLARLAEGVHENANFAYHGFSGLQEMLRRKNQQIDFYRLRGLNQAKNLLSKATALSEQKRLVTAIASGKVNRVDRIITMGLRQKKGVRRLLASLEAAAQGYYHPKSFTEEEDMRALLLWKLGGNQVAQINHRAQDAPSVSYLRTRSTVPPITPSHAKPTVDQVRSNVNATLRSMLGVLHSQIGEGAKVLHTVVMFDELAAEKRIRWDPKTNYFLGVCRQHAHKTSMEFINEGDLEELFRCLDDGDIHYAAEVRKFPRIKSGHPS